MPSIPFYIIPRWKSGSPILFFPDAPATRGNIVCYVHTGQHSEASMAYYKSTRRILPSKKERVAMHKLLKEYMAKLDPSEHLEIVRNDTKRFQAIRWSNYWASL